VVAPPFVFEVKNCSRFLNVLLGLAISLHHSNVQRGAWYFFGNLFYR
jgi:hypothetical protein